MQAESELLRTADHCLSASSPSVSLSPVSPASSESIAYGGGTGPGNGRTRASRLAILVRVGEPGRPTGQRARFLAEVHGSIAPSGEK